MKKFLKIAFVVMLIYSISISLTGCGKKNNDDIINKIDNNNKQNNEKKNGKGKNDTSSEEVKLYSDDTKVVFNMSDLYYLVYYHNGVNITGLQYVYNYSDLDTAKFTESMLKATYKDNDNVEKVERHGKQIIITFNESEYRGETVENIKAQYSMLEEIIKN